MTNLTFTDIKDISSNSEKLSTVKQDFSSIDKDGFLKVLENANKANNFSYNNSEKTSFSESESFNTKTFTPDNSVVKNYLTNPVNESEFKNKNPEKENTDKLPDNTQNKKNYINTNKQENISEDKVKQQEKTLKDNSVQDNDLITNSEIKVKQNSDNKSKKQVSAQKEEKTENINEETKNQESKDKKVSEQSNKEIKTDIDKVLLETRIQLATTVDINIAKNQTNESSIKTENKLNQNNSTESLYIKVNINPTHEKVSITQQTDQNSKLKIKIDNFQQPETPASSNSEVKLFNNAVKSVKENNTDDKLFNNAVKSIKENNADDKLSNNAVKSVKENNTDDKLFNNAIKSAKGNNTDDKLSNNTAKSIKEENGTDKKVSTASQLQENTRLSNKSADVDTSKKKIEVMIQNDHPEVAANSIKQEQSQTSSINQKDLDDILSKNIAAKPVVTKLEAQNNTNGPSSGQKQKQNLTEEQTSKLTGELIQAGDTVNTKVGTEQAITFDKVLESTQESKVDTKSIIDQVNQKISGEIKSGKTEITMSLRPESLGKVDINLVSEKGVVTAQITTENSQVKEVLNKEIDILKQKLQDQGVNLDKVVVKIQEPAQTNNTNSNFNQDSQKFNQTSQNASNSSDFNSSKQAQDQTGQNHVKYNSSDFNAEADLNAGVDEIMSEMHQGMIDYRI